MEVIYPRCAGLDVHKDTVVAWSLSGTDLIRRTCLNGTTTTEHVAAGSSSPLAIEVVGLRKEFGAHVAVDDVGTVLNPLLLKDAWALAWNEKPHLLDVQTDGLTEVFIAYAEYGVCEWFDSSGVSLNIS